MIVWYKSKLGKANKWTKRESKDNKHAVNAKPLEKDNELQALKKQMLSIEQAQKETQKQLEELLKYRSKTMGMLMRNP